MLNVAGDHDPFTPLTHFSLARAPGMAFSDDDQRLLRTLWPDLRQALHAYWALRALHGHNRHIEAAVDDLPQPAWVLRADATIEFSNREAMRVAAANRWVRTSLGRLRGIGNLEQADLMEALRAAVLGKGSALVASLAEARKLERLVLRIAPLAAESPYLAVWPRACALLLLDVPVPPDSDAQWLARAVQQFHLTGAEARLLRKFATGEAVTAVAKQAGLSIHTVRSHLRSIYEKTGCHRQAELMQMFGRH